MTRHPSRTRSVNRVLRGLRKTHRIDSRTFGLARTGEEIGASAQHPVPTGETTDGVRRDVSYVSLPRKGPPPLRLRTSIGPGTSSNRIDESFAARLSAR